MPQYIFWLYNVVYFADGEWLHTFIHLYIYLKIFWYSYHMPPQKKHTNKQAENSIINTTGIAMLIVLKGEVYSESYF